MNTIAIDPTRVESLVLIGDEIRLTMKSGRKHVWRTGRKHCLTIYQNEPEQGFQADAADVLACDGWSRKQVADDAESALRVLGKSVVDAKACVAAALSKWRGADEELTVENLVRRALG